MACAAGKIISLMRCTGAIARVLSRNLYRIIGKAKHWRAMVELDQGAIIGLELGLLIARLLLLEKSLSRRRNAMRLGA